MMSTGADGLGSRKRSYDTGPQIPQPDVATSAAQQYKTTRAPSFGPSWYRPRGPWSAPIDESGVGELAITSPAHGTALAFPLPGGANFFEETSPLYGGLAFTSPETLSTFDEYAANPQFLQLQEELRSIIFTGVQSLAPSRAVSPDVAEEQPEVAQRNSQTALDLSRTSIPLKRKIEYLKIWTTECAPWLDMFDASRHFGVQAPIMAQSSPALLYGILALSARQLERKRGLEGSYDSIQLYQESISLLTPILEAKDPNVLVTACILCCLEMMSVNPRDWRRHVEGCAALFESFNVNGFSGGLLQAVFWCYARMDLCGAIISDGAESTVLPMSKWVGLPQGLDREHPLRDMQTRDECQGDGPDSRQRDGYQGSTSESGVLPSASNQKQDDKRDEAIKEAFISKGTMVPDMYANYAVYLCAKTCDLVSRRTRYLELNEDNNCHGPIFDDQWTKLWDELQNWVSQRPPEMLPIKTTKASSRENGQLFPEIFFAHWAAISSNQLYHTACIMMLEIKPTDLKLHSQPSTSPVWHARRVCGISLTNPHRGCLNNAIQPLYVAGKLLSHRSEHVAIVKLIRNIEETTGWGACWRLKDLERAWGYDRNGLSTIK